jgi:hypothetical protein
MSRQPRRFQPALESLEDRCTPSGVPGFDVPDTQPALLPAGAPALLAGSHGEQVQIIYGDTSGHADTRVVLFKITGGGSAPGGLPLGPAESGSFNATGTATELGRYTSQGGTLTLDTLDPSTLQGTFHGSITFVAANGDHLAFNFAGNLSGTPNPDGAVAVTFLATFTPDAQHSTGRFADVSGGSFTMTAHADSISLAGSTPGFSAPFDYTWSGEGTLDFSNGKK